MTKFPDKGFTPSERSRIRKVFQTEDREDYELLIHKLAVMTYDFNEFGVISLHPAMLLHKLGFLKIELYQDTHGNRHTVVDLTTHFMKAIWAFIGNSEPEFSAMMLKRPDPSKLAAKSSLVEVLELFDAELAKPTNWFGQTNYLFNQIRLFKELGIETEWTFEEPTSLAFKEV